MSFYEIYEYISQNIYFSYRMNDMRQQPQLKAFLMVRNRRKIVTCVLS